MLTVSLFAGLAKTLMTQAPDLLAEPPAIERLEVLGAKVLAS